MSHIRTQINKFFSDGKVLNLFANSDGGQGRIDPEIDRHFSFDEVESIIQILDSDPFLTFLRNHDSHCNLQQFFKRLSKRLTEIQETYEYSKENEYILKIISLNKDAIHKNTLPCQIRLAK